MKRVIQLDKSSGELVVKIPSDGILKEGDLVDVKKPKIKRISYIGVVGDLFHYGHLQSIKFAKSQGDILVCGVFTNEAVEEYRRKPVANYEERLAVIESLNCVDRIMIQHTKNPLDNLKKIHEEFPEAEIVLVHGDNWRNVPGTDFIKSIGGKVVQHPYYERLSNFEIIKYFAESKEKFKDILDFKHFVGKDLDYDEEKGEKSIIFSKANTLNAIKSLLKKSYVPNFISFTIEDWEKNQDSIVKNIGMQFQDKNLIVRSSPLQENFFDPNFHGAGASNPISSNNLSSVISEIVKLIISYKETIGLNPMNQILVQEKVSNLNFRGNIFKKAANSYVLNYDELVNGEIANNHTIRIYLDDDLQSLSSSTRGIVEAIQEVEGVIKNINLDINFLTSENKIFIIKIKPSTKQFIHGWGETTSIQSMEAHTVRYVKFPENIGNAIDGSIYLDIRNKHHTCYFDKKDVERWNKEGKIFLQEAARNSIVRKNLEQIKRFKEFYEQHKSDDFQAKTNLELAVMYRDLLHLVMENGSYFPYSRQEITFPVKEKILSLIPSSYDKNKVFQLLTTPVREDLFLREEKDRLTVYEKENCNKDDLYQYALRNAYRFINTYSKKVVIDFLMSEKENTSINELKQTIKKKEQENYHRRLEQEKLFVELNSPLLQELCQFLQNIAVIRLENKNVWSGFEFQFLDLFLEISNRLGLNVDDYMFSYRIEETLQFLEERIILPYDTIKKRLNYFNLEIKNEDSKIEYQPRYNKEIDTLPKDKEIISGEAGNLGRTIGRALIVIDDSISSLMKLKKEMTGDDIYIAGMTHPAMVSLLYKAKGIITDEGGATCHAAIISRELNIPCLVGTKEATRFFKTGDFIEIDANNKFARKLSNKEIEKYLSQGLIKKVQRDENNLLKISKPGPSGLSYALMFSEIDQNSMKGIGGKGQNLVNCYSNYTVPNGFCITRKIYDEILHAFLDDKNELIIDKDNVSEKLLNIRDFILNYEFSEEFNKNIINKLSNLNSERFAVRSSASCEDSSKLSFAGQFKTILGIKTGKIFSAIKECLASVFMENVLTYASQSKIDYSNFFMAAVVQEFLPSEKAGVLFSKNPSDPQRGGFSIDANFGVGESVVSGEVKPDHYFVNGSESEIFVSDDKEAYSYIEDGKLSVEKKSGRVLDDHEIKQLVNLGEKLRRAYDQEIECEWAFFENKLHLLQVRPITTIEEE